MKFNIKKYRKWRRIDKWLQTFIITISVIFCADLLSGQTITTLALGILRLDNNATITSGQLIVPSGAVSSPSIQLGITGGQLVGIYRTGGGLDQLGFVVTNTGSPSATLAGQGALALLGNNTGVQMQDAFIVRDAANTLALKNANADQTQRWYGANGAYFQISTQSELLTIAAAASTDTTMTIPANSIVRGVAVFVVTAIPTAATFTVTGATSGTTFNTAAVGTGAGSNDVGTQNTPYKNGAAQKIRITPNLVPLAATGQVRIVLMYEIPNPPTS